MARHKIAGKPEYKLVRELVEAEVAFAAEPTPENKDRVDEAYRAWWRSPSGLPAEGLGSGGPDY